MSQPHVSDEIGLLGDTQSAAETQHNGETPPGARSGPQQHRPPLVKQVAVAAGLISVVVALAYCVSVSTKPATLLAGHAREHLTGLEEVSAKERAPDDNTDRSNSKEFMGETPAESEKKPAWSNRRASFLAIGDWGYDEGLHGWNINSSTCQSLIAQAMLEKMNELGDVQFVINVGDSFYPHGVESRSDWQWENKWRKMYDQKVRSVPWYSVYGNHDLQHDPCACSDDPKECAQINWDKSNKDFFYMPGWSYYEEHPDLDLEIIALETNHYMLGWDGSKYGDDIFFEDCEYTPCKETCLPRFKSRANESFHMFKNRLAKSKNKNMIVFSHYPTDYFNSAPEFMGGLRDRSKHNIVYFGGHRHSTDQTSTSSISPNSNWLVGGGGGWSCDGRGQGFVVGEIQEDYSIVTYPVLVDYDTCCDKKVTR